MTATATTAAMIRVLRFEGDKAAAADGAASDAARLETVPAAAGD
ncbi:MAG: hypothetical protein ABI681_06785 [Gemmatimonadales bacterium]